MSVKTDPASAEIPSAGGFRTCRHPRSRFPRPSRRARPAPFLRPVCTLRSARSLGIFRSLRPIGSLRSVRSRRYFRRLRVSPSHPAFQLCPSGLFPPPKVPAGRPAVSGYGAVCTDGAGPSGALPSVAGVPPSFGAFALAVYPFLELQPFHRAYYPDVLEAFAAGASGV